MLKIAEIYESLQGEGEYTGTPSVFVRTTGCNLRCWYCDTPFTSWNPEGGFMSVDQVLDDVTKFAASHVVVTGGEPLLQPGVVELCTRLREAGRFVTIETAGTVFRPAPADLMSVSPKLANSTPGFDRSPEWVARHENERHRPDVIRQLVRDYRCQFKFVIDTPADVEEVTRWLADFSEIDRSTIWLMPQATTREELADRTTWLQAAATDNGFRFTSRWHIEQFGNARGH